MPSAQHGFLIKDSVKGSLFLDPQNARRKGDQYRVINYASVASIVIFGYVEKMPNQTGHISAIPHEEICATGLVFGFRSLWFLED